eukprot:GEMP01064909.1.p1 GENE.GEMP01064909.1~~GEMP01064909.1.p1  ORF type:complete len:117 (+),score=8.72 GEMP01064909.1:316-666(+)
MTKCVRYTSKVVRYAADQIAQWLEESTSIAMVIGSIPTKCIFYVGGFHMVSIVRDVRYGDLVMAHFRVKSTKEKSRRPAEARVINTTTHNVGVQFTADSVVSTVPWEFIDERIIEL